MIRIICDSYGIVLFYLAVMIKCRSVQEPSGMLLSRRRNLVKVFPLATIPCYVAGLVLLILPPHRHSFVLRESHSQMFSSLPTIDIQSSRPLCHFDIFIITSTFQDPDFVSTCYSLY